MALTNARIVEEAQAIAAVCDEVKSLYVRIHEVLEHNSDLSIDWAATIPPSYITEDVNGNIQGLLYTRQQVANAIFSLDWIRRLLTNQSMAGSQGDHLGNINQLARP